MREWRRNAVMGSVLAAGLLAGLVGAPAVVHAQAQTNQCPEPPCSCNEICKCEKRGGEWINRQCVIPVPSSSEFGLNYHVLSSFYSPPGIGSEVIYGKASSVGTRTEIRIENQTTRIAELSSMVFQGELEVSCGTVSGSAHEVKTTAGTFFTYDAETDRIDHWEDAVYLWMNPTLRVNDDGFGNLSTSLKQDPAEYPLFEMYTLRQLFNPNLVPGYRRPVFDRLTHSDRLAILRMNPWFRRLHDGQIGDINDPIALNEEPLRFAPRTPVQVKGPDYGHGGRFCVGEELEFEVGDTVIQGNTSSSSDKFLVGGEVSIGPVKVGGAHFGRQVEFSFENVTENIRGQQRQAEAMLCSSTQCWHQWVQPYYDAAFGTFAFLPLTEGSDSCDAIASASGVVTDASGNPIPNQTVELTFDDGRKGMVGTDENGVYQVFDWNARPVSVRAPKGVGAAVLEPLID
jgi:hypothetical protein